MPLLFLLFPLLLALARADDAPREGWPHSQETQEAAPADEEPALDEADPRGAFLRWQSLLDARLHRDFPTGHPEPYRFAAELYGAIAPLVAERTGVVTPFLVGRTVKNRPIWGFRVHRVGEAPPIKVLVFAGIHAMEWISSEVATRFLTGIIDDPPAGVEVVVLPILNVDGRHRVELDLLQGKRAYRRGNANGVDLNRDFAVNRESTALWQKIIPAYYSKSPAPLSQPESQALDRLAQERFDVSVSLHAFGGFVYHPWSGRFTATPDEAAFATLGRVMVSGTTRPYTSKQLSRWGFFFRALGSELDHLYGTYGTLAYLVELTHSGIQPLQRETWKNHFRWYNPADPAPHVQDGVGLLRALTGHLSAEGLPPRVGPGPLP